MTKIFQKTNSILSDHANELRSCNFVSGNYLLNFGIATNFQITEILLTSFVSDILTFLLSDTYGRIFILSSDQILHNLFLPLQKLKENYNIAIFLFWKDRKFPKLRLFSP